MPRRWRPKFSVENTGNGSKIDCKAVNSSGDESFDLSLPQRLVGAPADLYTSQRKRFANSMNVVKLNFPFHDRRLELQQYRKWACELADEGLQAVVKASRLATHDKRLACANNWWPLLREAYDEFVIRGVLAAVLWQFAPTHRCSPESIQNLQELCCLLSTWTGTRHVFEFRHESWYRSTSVLEILREHGCCLAWLNLHDPQAKEWTDCEGWSLQEKTADFLYIQMHGSAGRALGCYSDQFLEQLSRQIYADCLTIVMFCQVDVPTHAWSNAAALRRIWNQGAESTAQSGTQEERSLKTTSGQIVNMTARLIFLDVGGVTGILGRSHLRGRASAKCRVGEILDGLRIEATEKNRIWLSCGQSVEESPTERATQGLNTDCASESAESLAELLQEIDDCVFSDGSHVADRWCGRTTDTEIGTRECKTAELSSYLADATIVEISGESVYIVLSSGLKGVLGWDNIWGGRSSLLDVGDELTVVVQRGGRTSDQTFSMGMGKRAKNIWASTVAKRGRGTVGRCRARYRLRCFLSELTSSPTCVEANTITLHS